jgi:hypothetical protein
MSTSRSLTAVLLFEDHTELPRFDEVREADLFWEQVFHLRRNIQVLALNVGHHRVSQPEMTRGRY